MHRRFLLTAIVLAVFCGIMSIKEVLGAVVLVRFEAIAQPDDIPTPTILVEWETDTELETTGFRLYRAESASPADWGNDIYTTGKKGDGFTGATYEYVDSAVSVGVKYYYRLEELLSSGGTAWLGEPRSAGINVPADTPVPTATATRAPSATSRPSVPGIVLTDTPAPTATRQFTNTPAVPSGTPPPGVQPTTPPIVQPTATPLPPASVNTPTGTAPQAPAGAVPTPTALAPAPAQAVTPTPQQVAVQPAGLASRDAAAAARKHPGHL